MFFQQIFFAIQVILLLIRAFSRKVCTRKPNHLKFEQLACHILEPSLFAVV